MARDLPEGGYIEKYFVFHQSFIFRRYTMYKKVLPGLFLALIAVPAFAAPAFEVLDSDSDGVISQSEARTAGISKELFVKFDLDKDATLNADEYKALVKSVG
jgi:hypothetical protein